MQLRKSGDSLANYREHNATYQFTLSTLDPKRDDGKAYSIAYIPENAPPAKPVF